METDYTCWGERELISELEKRDGQRERVLKLLKTKISSEELCSQVADIFDSAI